MSSLTYMMQVKWICCLLIIILAVKGYEIVCFNEAQHIPISFKLNDREELTNTIYPDILVVVDSLDMTISKIIKSTGTWTPYNLRTFGRLIKKGDTILNVGAHNGIEAIVYSKITEENSKLYFFEPYYVSRNILIKNLYLNGLGHRSTVYPYAASNVKTKAYLMVNILNTGASQIQTEQSLIKYGGARDEVIKVEVDLVDNILDKNAIIDFALVDVEKLDVQCLEGMKETIKRSPNMKIVIQWVGYSELLPRDQYLNKLSDLLDWFESLNYKFWHLGRERIYYEPTDCKKQKFVQMSKQRFFEVSDQLNKDRGMNLDFAFIPGHIDPNQL